MFNQLVILDLHVFDIKHKFRFLSKPFLTGFCHHLKNHNNFSSKLKRCFTCDKFIRIYGILKIVNLAKLGYF